MSPSKPEPVELLWGESDFLLRETAEHELADTRPRFVDAAEWTPGTATSDLATPSLFGEARAIVVTTAQALPEEAVDELVRYAAQPSPDTRLILLAVVGSGAKGPPPVLARRLKGLAPARKVAIARRDLSEWVSDRARAEGVPATSAGISVLIDTVGEDPAVLAQSIAQVNSAFPDEGVTPTAVAAQFRGFGERRIWDLCDAAFVRDLPTALRHLAAMLESRDEPLAILGGIAARLRDLLRVSALPAKMPPAKLAEAAGLRFDWQARRYRDQARRYNQEELAGFHGRIVQADRALKMGAAGDVVLAQLVAGIAS
ncbi:MAG: DNA polymerase III subunit delta [Actinomycetota bacterium]